jgi:UDP-glucose 4-epimerase
MAKEMERALITGGAGCIGSVLAERLAARGDSVRILDNLSSGRREHLAALEGAPGFEFIEGDLLDLEALTQAMHQIDIVYHLAANPDIRYTPGDPTDKDLRQNTIATHGLLEAMRAAGVRRLVFSSSSAVYGVSDRSSISETDPVRPVSLYGATKLASEALIGAFQNLFGMRCWIFRFANIVGGRVRTKGRTVIGDFIHKLRENPVELEILGDGQQAKSYLHVDECVGGMLHAVEHARSGLNILNLGCSDNLTVRRIADLVAMAMGLAGVQYRFTGGPVGWPGDVPRFRLDVTAMAAIGWRTVRNSEQAVVEAIGASLGAAECKR